MRPINVHECEAALTRWLTAQRLEAQHGDSEEQETLYALEEMLDWARAHLPDGAGITGLHLVHGFLFVCADFLQACCSFCGCLAHGVD